MKRTTMTAKRAKAIALEVWEYLAEHPEIYYKGDLPKGLYAKIRHLSNECPLCELFYVFELSHCRECPLKSCSPRGKSLYGKWCDASSEKGRKTNAQKIAEKIRAWEPGEPPAAKRRQGRTA
jgi:hypothetical protein